MATYVLIHGACHDGSAFDRVVERLREQGHSAYAPTVAGHGMDVDKRVTHAESVQSVLDFILDRELTDSSSWVTATAQRSSRRWPR